MAYVHTGARRAEALKLQWKDVDFSLGTLTFRKTKNSSDRQIRIPAKLHDVLRAMPRRSPYVFVNNDGLPLKNCSDRQIRIPAKLHDVLRAMPRRSPYVFVNNDGLPLKNYQLDWLVKRFQQTFPSEKKWTLHAFRHSFAHNFLKTGGQMYQLQAILGHQNIDVTIRVYGRLKAVEIENPSPYNF